MPDRHLFTGALVRAAAWRDNGDPFPEIDGTSPAIRRLKQRMMQAAKDPFVTVLVLGESGTGKERIARGLHRLSPRRSAPFEVVNCAGLSAGLIEDELFGHVRGAFTGAVQERASPFERADGGTVFLDEIGELPLDLQIKLLRVLQQRTVRRLGGARDAGFDVRVISATNVDLARAVAARRFRADLYFRLRVFELRAPSLRERGPADVGALADAVLQHLCGLRRRRVPALDPAVLDCLREHDWPGNVRELENVLEAMLVMAGDEAILRRPHLPDGFPTRIGMPPARRELPARERVIGALREAARDRGAAAAALGLSRHQLYRLMKRHGIEL